jgi:hypothetical protein
MKRILTLILVTLTTNAWALSFDSDVPADIATQMKADLQFINQLQGSGQTPFHAKIFGAVDGAKYQTFFETRVQAVGLDACGGGAAVACVQPMFAPNKMWLTENFIKFSHPQIARMMVVYHEARHTERANGWWSHATCPTPFLDEQGHDKVSIWTGAPLAGEPACDKTAMGSYGSSTIMLKNVAKFCTNCNDKVKMDADLYATDQLGRISDPKVKQSMIADFNANAKK